MTSSEPSSKRAKTNPLLEMAELENVDLLNFIDNEFHHPESGKYMDVINPATGVKFGRLAESSKADVDRAILSSKKAFKTWSKTTSQQRSIILNKIADLIDQNLDVLAAAESRDQGKPVTLAKTVDIPRAALNFRFFAGAILHHEEISTQMDGLAMNYTVRKPLGVTGLISPWNLPLYLLTWKLAPALAVGNTAICKPSEFSSLTAYLLCLILKEAGVPAGVCNMVFGAGHGAGAALVAHPDVPLISFTGGTSTGQIIMRDAALNLKKLYLELGGKNPNIIFDDANLDECVATTVRSSFQNQGEICLCGSRIFVHEAIYDKFVSRFVEETKKLVVGDPSDPNTTMGAIVSKPHLEKVMSYVKLAKEEGGQILTGGVAPVLDAKFKNGNWLMPTIITNLPYNCRTQTEEIFGPVVGITKFKTEEEVIEMANSISYGLSASLWTENAKRAIRVSQQIESGYVWVNCWMLRDLRVPFGGMKYSGLGRAGGAYSIDFYTEQKTICMKYTQ